jgi:carbamoyltransferase
VNIIGISAFYHDSACALVQDGELVAAVQEERFTRRRFDKSVPLYAYRACLEHAGLTPADIDCVAYYEDPVKKLGRQLWMELPRLGAAPNPPVLDATHPEREIRERLGFDGRFEVVDHHEAHAATAFYSSGFPSAALFTADAVGEWATTSYGVGDDDGVRLLEEVAFPHSLGLFYSVVTSFLGFAVNSDEYKVMGLASYGKPRMRELLETMVLSDEGGQFRLDQRYFDLRSAGRMYTDQLAELLGMPPRRSRDEVAGEHEDLAASIQSLTEDLLLGKLRYLHALSPSPHLCYSGGVALNCVANTRVRRKGPFTGWFIPPSPGDSGSAAGAAQLVHHRLTGRRGTRRLTDARLGPKGAPSALAGVLDAAGVHYEDYTGRESELLTATATLLTQGKVIGWHQGRMEFGPRALGSRSILGDPRDGTMRDQINMLVKKREEFRPFAPAVAAEHAERYFDLDVPSPFMLETVAVLPDAHLPAVTHVDGSARVQTVTAEDDALFHALLVRFGELTGVPVLLNTSFNVKGEPIVGDELDALSCFLRARLHTLVAGPLVVHREDVPPAWYGYADQAARYHAPAVSADAYTFFV